MENQENNHISDPPPCTSDRYRAPSEKSAPSLLPLVITVYSTLTLLGVLGIYFFQGSTALNDSFRIAPQTVRIFGWAVMAAIGVVICSALSAKLLRVVRLLEEEFAKILGSLTFWQIFILAGFSAVGEEIFFRGAIQPHLGLIITSLLFGLLHFPVNKKLIPWTVFAVGMGFLLGGLYLTTGSLVAPIITHFLINFINLFRLPANEQISSGTLDGSND
ncbi:MAG: CPBP family intramembrane metalloprotease [Planctomycetes bacterium]|nr:CPBP family intramembrane metalloprotease [Planctomycetota bacterium]